MATADKVDQAPATKHRHGPLVWTLVVVVILLASGLVYTIFLNRSLSNPEAQTKLAAQASQEIIDKVAKIIIVPADKPTVATITDVNKLKQSNSVFYKDARNGDVLLIYNTEAIIYRKEENRVIAVAPVVVNPTGTEKATKNTTSNETNNTSNEASNTSNETNSEANNEANSSNNAAIENNSSNNSNNSSI